MICIICPVVTILIIFFIGLTHKIQLEIQDSRIELEIMNNNVEDLRNNNINNKQQKQSSRGQGIEMNKIGSVSVAHAHALDGSNLQNIVHLIATYLRTVDSVVTVATVRRTKHVDVINGGNGGIHVNGGTHARYTYGYTDIKDPFNNDNNLKYDNDDRDQLTIIVVLCYKLVICCNRCLTLLDFD